MFEQYTDQFGCENIVFMVGDARAEGFSVGEKLWKVSGLFVPVKKRGNGSAKRLLAEMGAWADTHNLTLIGKAAPIFEDGTSVKKLVDLYARFGFEIVNYEDYSVSRKPRNDIVKC